MRVSLMLGLVLGVMVLPDIADAQQRRYRRDYDERDDFGYYPSHRGFMLRLTAGVGGVTADDNWYDETLRGGAGFFSLDLGTSIARNLAIHGRLSANSAFEPTVSSDGEDLGELEDTSLSFSLIGAGLTYYTPSNLYLTGVIGFSRATFEYFGDEYDSLDGLGFMADVGYEWPLGGDFGLGVAGRLELHSVRGYDEELSGAALAVLLSFTYF